MFSLRVVVLGRTTAVSARDRRPPWGRRKRGVAMALQGAERAAGLTGRLLAFARRQSLDPKPLDLNVLVRDYDRAFASHFRRADRAGRRAPPAPVDYRGGELLRIVDRE